MRAITAGLFISLDGVVEAPQNWHFPYLNDQMHTEVGAQMLAADTMLLGRNTYEEFAGHWATQGSDVPFADQINGIPKLVASRTLTDVTWQNSCLIDGDVATELRALKSGPGKNIASSGSPTLVRHLLEEDLLDELHLLVHPLVVGTGQRLFPDGSGSVPLELTDSAVFDTGVLNLTYRRSGDQH